MKFAEAFGFGRENSTGMSNLVLSSRDASQDGPLAKLNGEGTRKGKLVGAAFFWLLFFRCCKKSNSPSRLNQMINKIIKDTFSRYLLETKQQHSL